MHLFIKGISKYMNKMHLLETDRKEACVLRVFQYGNNNSYK